MPGVELVFTQTATGQVLSFYWQLADRYHIDPNEVVRPAQRCFLPVSPESYQERLRPVLDDLMPLQFDYPFLVADQYLLLELAASPVLMPPGVATMVLVTGQRSRAISQADAYALLQAPPTDRLPAEAAIARPATDPAARLTDALTKIRQTLSLPEVQQRTVEELGQRLGMNRCVLYLPDTDQQTLTAVAGYARSPLPAVEYGELLLDDPLIQEAWTSGQPILTQIRLADRTQPTALLLSTYYQDQPNGLLVLCPPDRSRWHQSEQTLREVADQVGTALDHALKFQAVQHLSEELQRVNESLMKQHSDLEEARQQAEAASRLKSEFLANTSHELRTPLNGVIGFLKLVLDDMADDGEEKELFIQEAYRSATRLMEVIQDILDIAKIEAGKLLIDLNPVKLNELLSEVERMTYPMAQERHLSFEIRTPDTRDEIVLYGNYQRLLQVMLNLVGNAIKFTHEGGVTISAEVIREKLVVQEEEMPGTVKISVADTGIGVSLEKQDQLFQTFNQIDGSRTRQYGGTGLGLAISQKLVEAMGGVVNFFSMGEGLGSTVTFTVPLYINPVMVAAPLTDSADLLL